VRAGHVPKTLPTDADFDTDGVAAQAYESAWLACRLIAERAGPSALVRLYRAVGTAADPAAALDKQLRATVGQSTLQFTAAWRASVRAEFG
jgi:hypothetical protein